jgi:hypothetical protein
MLPSRQPLLIVPIRDRRQGRRILTIRNCAISMLAVAVVIATFSIYRERQHSTTGGYGRLFGSEVTATDRIERKADVINEGTVVDQSAPDPMLVAPAAREQVLGVNANGNAPVTTTTISPVQAAPIQGVAEGHGTAIVGDGKGVTIVKAPGTSTAPHPVLSGGIFKQK